MEVDVIGQGRGGGRKPAPTALKILRGMRKDRINFDEPPLLAGFPDCPDTVDEVGRQQWNHITAQLREMGMLSRVDANLLVQYCITYSRWKQALEDIRNNGLVIETRTGVKTNPAVNTAFRCEEQMARFYSEYGMTPSSRSRVTFNGPKPADPLSEFLGKRKA